MKKKYFLAAASTLSMAMPSVAQDVSLNAVKMPADKAFSIIMRQTGKNFIYSSGTLDGIYITVSATDVPLEKVLSEMFKGKGISYSIKGNNVMLKKEKKTEKIIVSGYVTEASSGEALIRALVKDNRSMTFTTTNSSGFYSLQLPPGEVEITVIYPDFNSVNVSRKLEKSLKLNFPMSGNEEGRKTEQLEELVVIADKNKNLAMDSPEIGRVALSRGDILATPTLFGEADIVKTLQLEPGVSAGIEGLAGMYVHGGENDENLYMLDNVPLYQVNHFGGLFSAFNTEAVKNADFYKSSFPAKYNGRLSSILEVQTKDGNLYEHNGSFKLGLTSGAFQIDGPIMKGRTTYSFALRRSWFDLLSIPALAIYNGVRQDKENETIARYAFSDINAKITHRFSERSSVHAMFYYGEDYLKGGEKKNMEVDDGSLRNEKDVSTLKWGNIVGALGWNYEISDNLFSELTLAYTKYNSSLRQESGSTLSKDDIIVKDDYRDYRSNNSINDISTRVDFGWNPSSLIKVDFGGGVTSHSFTPQKIKATLKKMGVIANYATFESKANAFSSFAYAGANIDLPASIRMNVGLNLSSFNVSSKSHLNLDPRLNFMWTMRPGWNVKAGWNRMSQYVHQLTESAISLPTDQWVPIQGSLPPQRSDKLSIAVNHTTSDGFTISLEGYWKWLSNVIDYRDDYFLYPEGTPWETLLCIGKGEAKGIDLKISKTFGPFSGHVSYSLLWADWEFKDKNGGRKFPARFDNRHKINVALNWKINDKWVLNAAWTGMSGNMVTLQTQQYDLLDTPGIPGYTVGIGWPDGDMHYYGTLDFGKGINNYRLPFYHRLDLSANRKTKNGMWTFSLYNAYCYMNVISIKRNDSEYFDGVPFRKYRLIPIIPSVSYTWFY
ncbi:MAG: TonB-dependent receptor [Muribaculaceae bacterium]